MNQIDQAKRRHSDTCNVEDEPTVNKVVWFRSRNNEESVSMSMIGAARLAVARSGRVMTRSARDAKQITSPGLLARIETFRGFTVV